VAAVILEVFHDAAKLEVEIRGEAGNRSIRLDGKELACDWRALGDGRYSLLLDGRVHDLAVELDDAAAAVLGRDGELTLRLVDPRRPAAGSELEERGQGLRRILAEMPGKVVRILVSPGDTVVLGQGLVVLEAMKMQNEIPAPRRGTVKDVGVAVGRTVSSGDFLLSLE